MKPRFQCTDCGAEIIWGARNCPGCGKAVEWPSEESLGKTASESVEPQTCPKCGTGKRRGCLVLHFLWREAPEHRQARNEEAVEGLRSSAQARDLS